LYAAVSPGIDSTHSMKSATLIFPSVKKDFAMKNTPVELYISGSVRFHKVPGLHDIARIFRAVSFYTLRGEDAELRVPVTMFFMRGGITLEYWNGKKIAHHVVLCVLFSSVGGHCGRVTGEQRGHFEDQ
jgi:hypothetical protein